MRRFRTIALALTLALGSPACAQVSSQPAPRFCGDGQGVSGDRCAVSSVPERLAYSGNGVGVVQDGQLVHVGASGVQDTETSAPVNAQTFFRIASMSKAFTALAILKLRDEGKLRLDELAETYVPELKGWKFRRQTRRVSVCGIC